MTHRNNLIQRLRYHAQKQYVWGNWDVAELLEEAAYELEGSNVRILRRTKESEEDSQDANSDQQASPDC